MAGVDSRTTSPCITRLTSASTRNVAVSDQFRTDTRIVGPGSGRLFSSMRVNGQGPAMHDTRAFRNWLPVPASKTAELTVAFHFPSGEHTLLPSQAIPPVFTASNVFTSAPMLAPVVIFVV